GYRYLLDAAKLVWQKYPDTHFVVIGPSVRDSNKVFDLYKDSRIHRLGKVSFQEKTDALAACTLLCAPSSQESFGGVYTEAWMFEKPVIGCDIPAIAEVIDDEVNGFLVQQQPKMIAQRILDLLDNPAAARAMGESGKEKVAQNYTWPAIAQKATAAYNKTIAGSATH
ncbi:MAG: glycosyltransferase family 4 protein, partial [Phormidesmis sp.]